MLWKHASQTIIIVSTAFQLLTNFHETVFLELDRNSKKMFSTFLENLI